MNKGWMSMVSVFNKEFGLDKNQESLHTIDVSVDFEGLVALSQVNLSLKRFEILGLIGPNGAGKTTLINVLTGFQQPSSGNVFLYGQSINDWGPPKVARAGISRTFQGARLFHQMSVLENVIVAGIGVGLSKNQAKKQAVAILKWVGCLDTAHRIAANLPYGDERRVGLARALATNPDFILLDEPAAGMNENEQEELITVIRNIPERFSCGVLLIEHNINVIVSVCQRMHVLNGGKTVVEGTPEEVLQNTAVQRAYLGCV